MDLVRFKPYLKDQLASFRALTVGLVIWPVKIVPDVTYDVFGGTLNLSQSITRLWPLSPSNDQTVDDGPLQQCCLCLWACNFSLCLVYDDNQRWQSNVLGPEIMQPVQWLLFCHRRANTVEQSAWTASATAHHLRTVPTIVENVYVRFVGLQCLVSELRGAD